MIKQNSKSRHGREIEEECRRLMVAFANELDVFDYDAVLAMCVAECVFIRDGEVYEGLGGIRELLESRRRDRVTRHVTSNMLVEVIDESHARGRSYCQVFGHLGDLPGGLPAPLEVPDSLVEFDDEFVATKEGWRFARRRLTHIFRKDEEKG
jgi:hypothetical protein